MVHRGYRTRRPGYLAKIGQSVMSSFLQRGVTFAFVETGLGRNLSAHQYPGHPGTQVQIVQYPGTLHPVESYRDTAGIPDTKQLLLLIVIPLGTRVPSTPTWPGTKIVIATEDGRHRSKRSSHTRSKNSYAGVPGYPGYHSRLDEPPSNVAHVFDCCKKQDDKT